MERSLPSVTLEGEDRVVGCVSQSLTLTKVAQTVCWPRMDL